MITKKELIMRIEEANSEFTFSTNQMRDLSRVIPADAKQALANNKEMKRLMKNRKRTIENRQLLEIVDLYIESGASEESIKDQLNQTMIKLSSIDERLKFDEHSGDLRRDKDGSETPLKRSTKNPEEKKLIDAHDRKYGRAKLKKQLNVLNFILKN